MITLLVYVLILVLLAGAVVWAIGLFHFPEPFANIARGIVALIFLLIIIGVLFGGISLPPLRS